LNPQAIRRSGPQAGPIKKASNTKKERGFGREGPQSGISQGLGVRAQWMKEVRRGNFQWERNGSREAKKKRGAKKKITITQEKKGITFSYTGNFARITVAKSGTGQRVRGV